MDTVDIAGPAPRLVSAPTFFGLDQRYLVDGISPLIFLVTAGSDLWLDKSLEFLEDRGWEWEKEARIRFAAGGGNNPVQPLITFRCRFTVGCRHTIASPPPFAALSQRVTSLPASFLTSSWHLSCVASPFVMLMWFEAVAWYVAVVVVVLMALNQVRVIKAGCSPHHIRWCVTGELLLGCLPDLEITLTSCPDVVARHSTPCKVVRASLAM
jgi:hypothetical protein